MLPPTGAVPPNSAIVLDAHVVGLGGLGVDAHVGASAVEVLCEVAPPFSIDRFVPGGGARYLVRPARGEWPPGATVRLAITNGSSPPVEVDVPIGDARDVTPPTFSSLSPPTLRTFSRPGRTTEVTGIAHGAFDDPASPLVLVDLASGPQVYRFAVTEGLSGTLLLDAEDNALRIDAITLSDVAGNSLRVEAPCGLPAEHVSPFVCLHGSIEAEGETGSFIATSDAGADGGFSRGHCLSRDFIDGDIEISVSAERLTGEHEMPIEIAFRGGFFAVTGTSSWFLYEHDRHWTGWQPTPVPVGGGVMSLRVVQRGQSVSGYVNGQLAGSFTLQSSAQGRAVGLAFKAHPGALGRVRFWDFAARSAGSG